MAAATTATEVTWLQAGACHVDLRPAAGCGSAARTTEVLARAAVEGSAGRISADGRWTGWNRSIDLHLPAPAPDEGLPEVRPGGLPETGRHEAYAEHGAEEHAIYRIDFDDPRHDGRLAGGDAEIAPGVTAVATPWHAPGHRSVVVDVDRSIGGGGSVFAFDAADLTENIDDEVSVGGRTDPSPEECVE